MKQQNSDATTNGTVKPPTATPAAAANGLAGASIPAQPAAGAQQTAKIVKPVPNENAPGGVHPVAQKADAAKTDHPLSTAAKGDDDLMSTKVTP